METLIINLRQFGSFYFVNGLHALHPDWLEFSIPKNISHAHVTQGNCSCES